MFVLALAFFCFVRLSKMSIIELRMEDGGPTSIYLLEVWAGSLWYE